MQKKLSILMIIITVSLAFFSCLDYSLPEHIELELEGSIDLPIKTATSNWGSLVIQYLKKSFPESTDNRMKLDIYDVDYEGQNIGALCAYINMELSDSFNPYAYLPDIDALTKLDGISAIEIRKEIEIPSFDFEIKYDIPSVPATNDPFPIKISNISDISGIPVDVSGGFLHALIQKGDFTISLEIYKGSDQLQSTTKYDGITISQEPYSKDSLGPYKGLKGQYDPASKNIDLKEQDINGSPIIIDGEMTVTITSPIDSSPLEGKLIIAMNITKFESMDWDFRKISDGLDDELQTAPISLTKAAQYLYWIEFEGRSVNEDTHEIEAGIGVNIAFKEMIEGLAMSVGCEVFRTDPQPLHKGNNVFGNMDITKLRFRGDEDSQDIVTYLHFNLELCPDNPGAPPGNNNVLHLTTDLEPGKVLSIDGEAKFFRRWERAKVDIEEALKAKNMSDNVFSGAYPDPAENEKPIDLSVAGKYFKEYLPGFEFKPTAIQASVFLSGPDKMIKAIVDEIEPTLSLNAVYNKDTPLSIIPDNWNIKLDENLVPVYLDDKGIYKKNRPPDDGNPITNFAEVINAWPDDLGFKYDIQIPPAIVVTKDIFPDEYINESVPSEITATIVLVIHLELTAGTDGGRITMPDMFKDQKDLLGRETLEEYSMFTSLNVGYLNLAIDLAGTFLTGGNFFIEKDIDGYKPILFPKGIPVNGSRIAVNISNEKLDIIRKHLINPDLRLEFDTGGTITIPKNIGLTSFKIEAKGKNSLKLDF